jgi:hypothetical protein
LSLLGRHSMPPVLLLVSLSSQVIPVPLNKSCLSLQLFILLSVCPSIHLSICFFVLFLFTQHFFLPLSCCCSRWGPRQTRKYLLLREHSLHRLRSHSFIKQS